MKHSLKITIALIVLFLAAQYIGLFIIKEYVSVERKIVDGNVTREVTIERLPYDIERPQANEKTSYIGIFFMILIATGIIMLIVYFKLFRLWSFWFFLSVVFTLLIGFGAFVPQWIALTLAVAAGIAKVFLKNPIVYNITELFIYGGLAAIFVPIMNLYSVIILLLLISVYDYIAVRRSKHMVKMADFQAKSKAFAGLLIPYEGSAAILGGGDIAFPLFFAGVIYKIYGMQAFFVPIFTGLALSYLFFNTEKGKFYPAMPYITVGCLVSLILLLL